MFTEDLTPFFSTANFGTAATLNGASVNGIFDNAYADMAGELVAGTDPVFRLPTTSASGAAIGSTLVIGSTSYTVSRPPQPDGTGVTLLVLQEA